MALSVTLPAFHPNRPQLVAPVRRDPEGRTGPTRVQARGKDWRPTTRGYYVGAEVDGSVVEQRIVEAAAVIPPGRGAVTGWAALRWLGGRWFTGTTADPDVLRPVDLAMMADIRPQAPFAICEEGLNPCDVIVVDGLPITIPVRSVAFMMRYAGGVREAVRAFDMAAFNDMVSIPELIEYAGIAPRHGLSSWTGMPQCRAAYPFLDENAWSPQEVTMRLVWTIDAGLPRPLTNVPIFDLEGRHIGTPDLLDLTSGLVGEYDGELHLLGAQRARDVRREEAFRDVGLESITMLAGDSADRNDLATRIVEARERALRIPATNRRWTIDTPDWWVPTRTVEQRRNLSAAERSHFLRYRAA